MHAQGEIQNAQPPVRFHKLRQKQNLRDRLDKSKREGFFNVGRNTSSH